MLASLAFLPHNEIKTAFNQLKSQFPANDMTEKFLKYFEETYISRVFRTGRGSQVPGLPLFHPQLWSVHNRTGTIWSS